MSSISVQQGDAPLILSLPHTGTTIPDALRARLLSVEIATKDTDFRIDGLYAFAADLGATLIRTDMSRTVIDVNRDPSGASLYPGHATTGLCPVETFDGEPLYKAGEAPDAIEIEERRKAWFDPYHATLQEEIARLRKRHGRVVVYDCHSIRSLIPRLFDGLLPVFNIGTAGGASCSDALTERVYRACASTGESLVVNGRFRGGWITRAYGKPEVGVHAIQMELAQRFYLDENAPRLADEARAERAQTLLRPILTSVLAFATGK